MSKAVLVIDMPESCDMCSFYEDDDYCGVPGCGEEIGDYIACRPDWCPLVPIPEKVTEPIDSEDVGKDYSEGTMDGWNAAIDAITGDVN